MNVLLPTHVLEYLWPYGDTALSKVRLFEQGHVSAGLPDATTNAQGYLVVYDCLVVWQLEEIKLSGHLQLFLERVSVNPNTHGGQLVAALCHRVPDKNITIETMHGSAVFRLCLRDPVVVVCRSHFVRVTVLEDPADPIDEDRDGFRLGIQ